MASSNAFSVADYLLTRLQQLGLTKVFQVPGDYVSHFMAALDDFDGIDAVGEVNEMAAAYAADGYARYAGIGAVSLQYSVGTFSGLNAIAGSYVERNPVVLISASPSAQNRQLIWSQDVLFHHSTGDLDVGRKVFEPVTVASLILDDSQCAPVLIDAALVKAISERRPIYLEAWQNVWGEPCLPPQGELQALAARCDEDSMRAAIEASLLRLGSARSPLIMLGIEVARFGLQEQVMRLIEASGLPFTTSLEAKTVVDESHPQFIGTYAGTASRPWTQAFMKDVDCILALGVIFTDDYLQLLAKDFSRIILVNTQVARTGLQYYPHVPLPQYLQRLLGAMGLDSEFPLRNHTREPAARPALLKQGSADDPLGYELFLEILERFACQQNLWADSSLILGESSALYAASNLNGLPRDSFVADAIWGSLGHETGCALGVAMGSGRRPIVVAGDGGFMMICQSLSTLARNRINALVFVMSNEAYAIEQAFVDINAFEPGGQFAPFDLLPTWDYLALAKGFGAEGFKVSTRSGLEQLLPQLLLIKDRPALIQVVIPHQDLAPQIKRLAQPDGPLFVARHSHAND
ncbi:thiamine pyrophosphate-binding protein [Pseudomonas sp. Fl4BN1]|uniref:thiamine pyrophosphate-binding protein n=1 Tax=Pseudomonas sp. Fl4BN1 TaxID=2697651 RepID=UPI001377C0D1|nr:thiamine pyrophosphate-binding protein [Pseudomonas sp. Fl4BN1]NBF11557.1 alpha-keto acid decarboxylase family protein [Pseudomonas sp. Fl4BN1]